MKKHNMLYSAVLTAALMAPAASYAFSLGDIDVHSYLGQPFRATIPIQANGDEEIESGCLKLAPPPAENDSTYLRRATLSVTSHGGSAELQIAGHFPLDEPYLYVVIKFDCKDQGQLMREYTVLVDPPEYAIPSAPPAPSGEAAYPAPKAQGSVQSRIQGTAGPERPVKKKPITGATTSKPAKTAKKRQDQLKVLSGTGEKPAQPGMSETERLQQREKELMKELDDKTAQHLEMKAQLVKLESKLLDMQKTLEQQNRLLASLQQPAPAKNPVPVWDNGYWLAGSFLLMGSLGYFLARRSRKQSMDNWQPSMRSLNTENNKRDNKPV